jgi:hypothetical protein
MKFIYHENDRFKKNDLSFRLCISETANYIDCLNLKNETQNKINNCEETRKKYLSCINNNFNGTKVIFK